jgi:hypothetical protein
LPARTVRERLEDGMGEVGTLLIAFAPLDAALNPNLHLTWLLLFFGLGVSLFMSALFFERSRRRGD